MKTNWIQQAAFTSTAAATEWLNLTRPFRPGTTTVVVKGCNPGTFWVLTFAYAWYDQWHQTGEWLLVDDKPTYRGVL